MTDQSWAAVQGRAVPPLHDVLAADDEFLILTDARSGHYVQILSDGVAEADASLPAGQRDALRRLGWSDPSTVSPNHRVESAGTDAASAAAFLLQTLREVYGTDPADVRISGSLLDGTPAPPTPRPGLRGRLRRLLG